VYCYRIIIDALNSDAKALIEILVERVTLYEHKIEISFRYSKNTNPDETLTERFIGTFFYMVQKLKQLKEALLLSLS
jgi:hypothetical protein